MEQQLTVRMSDELLEKLDKKAAALSRRRSEVVRLAIEQYLQETSEGDRPIDRVRDLLGRHESGIPDLGLNHRKGLLERLGRDR